MALMDEEFYCEKCNWFTYRSSIAPYFKPTPRCPRCGLETRIATAADAVAARDRRGKSYPGLTEADVVSAMETMERFHQKYPAIEDWKQQEAIKQAARESRKCRECGITLLTNSDTGLCDCCLTMFNAIAAQPRLREAHIQWEIENQRRIKIKQHLMKD